MKAWGVVVIGMLLAACAARVGGPPEIVVDRTACSHCGMLISEPMYAAAAQAPGAAAWVFDDIGCLLAATPDVKDGTRFWFHDAERGTWIDGEPAAFVRSRDIRSPMGGGILAFASHDAAVRAAAIYRGDVVTSLSALQSRTGGTQ